jgi:hypothetical protein
MKKVKVKIKLRNIEESLEAREIIKNSCRKIFHLEISYRNLFNGRIEEYWDPERGVTPCPLVEYFQQNHFILKNLHSLSILATEVSDITNILKTCLNLKDLKLEAMRWQEDDWLEVTESPIFKLKSLTITSDSITATCHEGLDKFLKTQTESLESFSMTRGVLDTKSIQTVMQMKRLNYWEIEDSLVGDIANCETLHSLEELRAFVEQNVLENSSFLRFIPNLRKLHLRHLNQRSIEIIGIQLKTLKDCTSNPSTSPTFPTQHCSPPFNSSRSKNSLTSFSKKQFCSKSLMSRLTSLNVCTTRSASHRISTGIELVW